jgi:hypothetical protein
MSAKFFASILLVINAIFITFLVDNKLVAFPFWLLSIMSIYYLFIEKEENKAPVGESQSE